MDYEEGANATERNKPVSFRACGLPIRAENFLHVDHLHQGRSNLLALVHGIHGPGSKLGRHVSFIFLSSFHASDYEVLPIRVAKKPCRLTFVWPCLRAKELCFPPTNAPR